MQIDEELTLKKLEVFLAFMRSGNLGKAAVELNTSNVSVHRAIHSLESALRCPLFKHEGRNLIPLESAYVLEERAQQLVKDVLETVRRTREAAGFSAERFKLGALYSLTVKTVPQLIMGLKLRRSELNIDLILGSNVDLLYKLKNMERRRPGLCPGAAVFRRHFPRRASRLAVRQPERSGSQRSA